MNKYMIQTYIFDDWCDYAQIIATEEGARETFQHYVGGGKPGTRYRLVEVVRSDKVIAEPNPDWVDASTLSYTAKSMKIGNSVISVCEDDEGPLTPAFYWWIEEFGIQQTYGWANTVECAERDACAARNLR